MLEHAPTKHRVDMARFQTPLSEPSHKPLSDSYKRLAPVPTCQVVCETAFISHAIVSHFEMHSLLCRCSRWVTVESPSCETQTAATDFEAEPLQIFPAAKTSSFHASTLWKLRKIMVHKRLIEITSTCDLDSHTVVVRNSHKRSLCA